MMVLHAGFVENNFCLRGGTPSSPETLPGCSRRGPKSLKEAEGLPDLYPYDAGSTGVFKRPVSFSKLRKDQPNL